MTAELTARYPGAHPWALVVWACVPVVLLLLAGLISAGGMQVAPPVLAATTDSVTVTGTSGAVMGVSDGCAGSTSWTVALGSYSSSPACSIDYGASNDPTQYLQIRDQDGLVNFQGTIPNTLSACAPMPGASDEAGVKIDSLANNSAINTATWGAGCAAVPPVGNDDYRAMPTVLTTACVSSVTNELTHRCAFIWGSREAGFDLAAGSYPGIAEFQVIDA